jgi:hypothetical protein
MKTVFTYRILMSLLFMVIVASVTNCGRKNPLANQRTVTAISTSKSESGFLYVKANGFGKNPKEAKNEAIRNAISSVLFKGVPGSSVKRPLISQPGARQAHNLFFDPFFADNGPYLDYAVVMSHLAKDRIKVKSGVQRAIILKVNYLRLQKALEQQGIIKKFGI